MGLSLNLKHFCLLLKHLVNEIVVASGSLGTMANPKHLAKIKQGVKVWNKWREEHPDALPDLSGTHLSETELKGAALWGANLERVDLVGSNLETANLGEANLQKAFLADTNLKWAILVRSNLEGAVLWGADLERADLMRANLKSAYVAEANLRRANLLEANLEKADFREANLTKVVNLSVRKLARVKTLHKARLDPELMERISNDYPHLLRSPGEEK